MNRQAFFFVPVLLLAAFLLPVYTPPAHAAEPIATLDEANQRLEEAHLAYERNDMELAARLYSQVAHAGFATPAVWANAGAAAYHNGDVGRAVLYYRRALKLDPAYDRALNSLQVISPATNDTDDGFGSLFAESLFTRTHPAMWILFAQFFLLLVWFSIARILAARDPDRRGHWISIFCWALAFTLLTGGVGYANHNFRQGGNEAVVIENRTITRSEPREDAPAQLELPAGTYVHLTESPRRGFVRVKLMDGRAGYISTAHIERI